MPQLEEKISKQAAQGEYNLCPVKSRVMVLIVRIESISFTKNYNFCQLNSARLSILREIEQTLEFRACVKFSVIGSL